MVISFAFFIIASHAQAAPILNSNPDDGSYAAIGAGVNYSWVPSSNRNNCIRFLEPGSLVWNDWDCLGGSHNSYIKDTTNLAVGALKAEVSIKKCAFFFWGCSWDYSNQASVNLYRPYFQEVVADIKANGSDQDISVDSGREVDITWSSTGAGSCNITPCTLSMPNDCTSPSGEEKAVVPINPGIKTTDFRAICFSPDGSEVSQPDVIRVTVSAPPKPVNSPPQVTPLAPQQRDYCAAPLIWTLSWNFSDPNPGDYQTVYQVSIAKADTGREVLSRVYYASSNFFAIPAGVLDFNTAYTWKIKVWDNNLASTEARGSNFATIPHRPPAPDFGWSPQTVRPSINQKIYFYDKTSFYDSSLTNRSWFWALPAGLVVLSPANQSSLWAASPQAGDYNVQLRTTDSDSLSCAVSKPVNVGKLPSVIKEIFHQ